MRIGISGMSRTACYVAAVLTAAWCGWPAAAEPAPAPAAAPRHHLVMLIAEEEYRTAETLPAFARAELGDSLRVTTLTPAAGSSGGIPGLDDVAEADVLLVSVRRRPLPPGQLDRIRRHVAAGRPVVGIRTANHAFHLGQGAPAAGLEQWPTFDADVFGGHYSGHLDKALASTGRRAPDVEHPILADVPAEEFATGGSLYTVTPLAPTTTVLMLGRAAGVDREEPVAWVNRRADGGRSFYTSLGHPDDFANPVFRRLLANAIRWAVGQPAPDARPPAPR
jgi:type 1 glutamine amidotransferase